MTRPVRWIFAAAMSLLPLAALPFLISLNLTRARVAPPPREITADSVAQFCGMGLNEHPGPKGQIFVYGRDNPYWFSSVRDTLAFMRLPEEPKDIAAVYVSDMGKVVDWSRLEPGNWIDAKKAWYVIGSGRHGGMDVDEAVPFGDIARARDFAQSNGGRVLRFDAVPDDFIFQSPSEEHSAPASEEKAKG